MKKFLHLWIILFYLASLSANGQKHHILDTDSIPTPQNYGPTDLIGVTNEDNENNFYTGQPDYDMDVYLGRDDLIVPIEFNIFIDDKTVTTAQLSILAWDVDWEGVPDIPGERDAVYLNDHFLGYLTGANHEWTTTIFDVNPAFVNPGPNGKNTVKIIVDVLLQSWMVNIDWGQLIINNPVGTAKFRYVTPDKLEYYAGETIYVSEEVDADPLMYVRVETNLVNSSGQIVAGTTYHQYASMGDEPFTVPLYTNWNIEPGDYQIMAILYDASTNIQQDIIYSQITIIDACINPWMGGYVGYSQRQCGAYDPDPIMNLQYPSYYTGNLEYKWQRSIDGINYIDIPGTNSPYYDPGMLAVPTWFRRLARVDCWDNWDEAAYSNYVFMDVLPEAILDAGPDEQIYIGYPPYEVQMNVTANGGGYFYWDPPTGLNNPYIANPIASPTETTTYNVMYYSYDGCIVYDEVTVNVTDVRCGKNMKKVLVCHHPPGNPGNAHTICIGAPAVPAHLEHGDYLGECLNGKDLLLNEEVHESLLTVYPNPTNGQTNIELSLASSAKVKIYVCDILGNVISSIYEGTVNHGKTNYSWNAGLNHDGGIYMLYVVTESEIMTRKIIVK